MSSFVQLQHDANMDRLRPLFESELKNVAGGGCSIDNPGNATVEFTFTMTESSVDTNEWDCPD